MNVLDNPNIFEFREALWDGKPVLITNGMNEWPAMSTWNLEYLRRAAVKDGMPLPLFHAVNARDTMRPLDEWLPIDEVMDRLWGARPAAPYPDGSLFYLKQRGLQEFPGLLRDVRRPAFYGQGIVEVNLWIGTAGCWSPMHFDYADNLMCHVAGTRRVHLFAPEQGRSLYPAYSVGPLNDDLTPAHFSMVTDIRHPDVARHPDFTGATPTAIVDLGPGQMLYVPPYWWHFVEITKGPAILVNFWYALQYGAPIIKADQDAENQMLATLRGLLERADPVRRTALAHVVRVMCETAGTSSTTVSAPAAEG
jgi:hypothetical protein